MISQVIRDTFEELKGVPQRMDYHPENFVYSHTAYVLDGIRTISGFQGQRLRELELVALFHDIAKLDCTRVKDSGKITSYEHSNKALYYWDAAAPLITMDVRKDVIRWLIDYHMKPKFFHRTKDRKIHEMKKEAEGLGDGVWTMLKMFSACDDMLDYFNRNGMEYIDASATERVEVKTRNDEALLAFGEFVDEVCNHIRSNAESSNGNKWLALVRGVPGSGKTTFAQEIMDPELDVDSDRYFMDENGGYNFDASKLSDAHNWCRETVRESMEDGVQSIAVHNTFTQNWEFVRYIGLAAQHGYRVYSIITENRHGGESEHGVPKNKVNQMKDRFQTRL